MKAVVPPADFVVVVWEKQCHGCDDDGAAKFTAIEVTQQLKLLQLKLRMVSAQDASMYFDGEDPDRADDADRTANYTSHDLK